MTNKTTDTEAATNTNSQTAAEDFIIDQDEEHEVQSPEPVYTTEGFGGIEPDHRDDTVFITSLDSEVKQPGTLTGESCPLADIVGNSYDYLSSQYPYWRRLLSDSYMRNTKLDDTPPTKKQKMEHTQLVLLHIDDHAWASVVHYLTASKFVAYPDIYNMLYLDSGSAESQMTAEKVKQWASSKQLTKEQEKDWYEQRKVEAWRRALLAKFAQNEDLQRALILTGWAKLVDKQLKIQHLLMWVRTVLRADQKSNEVIPTAATMREEDEKKQSEVATANAITATASATSGNTNNKNVDEVLRVIEGLFGKDKQHVLSSILGAQLKQQDQDMNKKVEPKVVEMKDAVGYLEQIKTDEPPQSYHKFLEIMTEFRSEKINTPQVLERVTLLFKGKPWLIRNFLMFLPPGHILTDQTNKDDIYITSPTGKKIIIKPNDGIVSFE